MPDYAPPKILTPTQPPNLILVPSANGDYLACERRFIAAGPAIRIMNTSHKSFGERLRSLYEYLITPELDWIQVEVTSHCESSCGYCPHTALARHWDNRHLTTEAFERLMPAIRQAKMVHLQGWGEPLLNPRFFDMVDLAKQTGTRVGVTTNGMLINAARAQKVVRSGMDLIAISAAGLGQNNDLIRSGTGFDAVLEAIQLLKNHKERLRSETPAIHLAWLLMRSNADDLKKLPQVLHGTGVKEIIVNTMDFIADTSLASKAVLPEDEKEFVKWRDFLESVRADARAHGIRLHYYLRHPARRRAMCTENAPRAMFISSNGDISPCVFTNLPLKKGQAPIKKRQDLDYQRLVFGNVSNGSLASIWRESGYTAFRKSFQTGKLLPPCGTCPKMFMLEG